MPNVHLGSTGAQLTAFVSDEQVSTGASQSITHALGRVPRVVEVQPERLANGELPSGYAVTEGTHTATSILVDVDPVGVNFRVVAI